MSPAFQTLLALGIVAVAATLLIWHFFLRKKQPGCGGQCGAVSSEIRKLQARLRH